MVQDGVEVRDNHSQDQQRPVYVDSGHRFAQIAVIARRRGEWGKSTQSGSPAIRRREHAPKSLISDREPLQSPL
jgi:hypothetical protein